MPTADVLGVIIGILFIIPTIYFIRTKDWDKVAWPFFLITLPVYYMLFGVLAMDGRVAGEAVKTPVAAAGVVLGEHCTTVRPPGCPY